MPAKKTKKEVKGKKSTTSSKPKKTVKVAKAKKDTKIAKDAKTKKTVKVAKAKKAKKVAKAKKTGAVKKGAPPAKATKSDAATNAPAKDVSGHPLETHERNDLPESTFAFPEERKEPLEDASHVRNAIARFDQVSDVSDDERDRAWERIKAAAKEFDVEISESDWRDLFKKAT